VYSATLGEPEIRYLLLLIQLRFGLPIQLQEYSNPKLTLNIVQSRSSETNFAEWLKIPKSPFPEKIYGSCEMIGFETGIAISTSMLTSWHYALDFVQYGPYSILLRITPSDNSLNPVILTNNKVL